jgi:hypothetical protein
MQLAGPFAWFGGQPGQVGNEAAIAVQKQCRSQARHTDFFLNAPYRVSIGLYELFGSCPQVATA